VRDLIIGVDCATQPKRTGLARAERTQDRYTVTELMVCDGDRHPAEIVVDWLGDAESALLALDAPLGWPVSLGRGLARHAAGEPIPIPGELLFRRSTDRVVAQQTGKTPLEIGADRIARTAHAALLFLDRLRIALDEPIPLAWQIPLGNRVEAIEVYPAATLLVRGASLRGYKKAEAFLERSRLLDSMAPSCEFEAVKDAAIENHDCLDALACVVAGHDFLQGEVVEPVEPDVARREGWIWFRKPGSLGGEIPRERESRASQ
jgi:predicted RNase H-like nuclease